MWWQQYQVPKTPIRKLINLLSRVSRERSMGQPQPLEKKKEPWKGESQKESYPNSVYKLSPSQ